MSDRALDKYFASRWPNFRPHELFSPDCYKFACFDDDRLISMLDPWMMDILQELREELRVPIWINHGDHLRRGVRTHRDQNYLVEHVKGSAKLSQHVFGRAVDMTIPESDMRSSDWLEELAELAEQFGFTGIGKYPQQNFVHADVRTTLDNRPVKWIIF